MAVADLGIWKGGFQVGARGKFCPATPILTTYCPPNNIVTISVAILGWRGVVRELEPPSPLKLFYIAQNTLFANTRHNAHAYVLRSTCTITGVVLMRKPYYIEPLLRMCVIRDFCTSIFVGGAETCARYTEQFAPMNIKVDLLGYMSSFCMAKGGFHGTHGTMGKSVTA